MKSFPGVGAFDHLEWTYDGAFEQLFGLGRGEFSKNFPKIQMPGGLPGGDVEASIWLVHKNHKPATYTSVFIIQAHSVKMIDLTQVWFI